MKAADPRTASDRCMEKEALNAVRFQMLRPTKADTRKKGITVQLTWAVTVTTGPGNRCCSRRRADSIGTGEITPF